MIIPFSLLLLLFVLTSLIRNCCCIDVEEHQQQYAEYQLDTKHQQQKEKKQATPTKQKQKHSSSSSSSSSLPKQLSTLSSLSSIQERPIEQTHKTEVVPSLLEQPEQRALLRGISSRFQSKNSGIQQQQQQQQLQNAQSHYTGFDKDLVTPIVSTATATATARTTTPIESITTSIDTTSSNPPTNGLWAVVHIGPTLTGTSAIEASVHIVQNELLNDDNYEDAVVHALNNPNYRKGLKGGDHRTKLDINHWTGCFRPESKNTHQQQHRQQQHQHNQQQQQQQQQQRVLYEITCHPHALEMVHQISTVRNHNVLIHADHLTDPRTDIGLLYRYLRVGWENHKIVAYYRRYYDWLASMYYKIYKHHRTDIGKRKSITDFIEEEADHSALYKTLYVFDAVERYRKYFNYIEVINIYDNVDDVRTAFYCQAMLNGNNTSSCKQMQKYHHESGEAARLNHINNHGIELSHNDHIHYYHHSHRRTEHKIKNFVYSDLVYYAKVRGILTTRTINTPSNSKDSYLSDHEAILETRYYQEKILNKTAYDFHKTTIVCPLSKAMNTILARSKYVEQTLFPSYYKKTGQDEIIQHYDNIQRTHQFCHIDAEAVLELQPEWTIFFQQLNNNPNLHQKHRSNSTFSKLRNLFHKPTSTQNI